MVYRSCLRLAEMVVKETSASLDQSFLRLPPLPSPRELLKLYKISAQRNLSQNFLLDSRINNKIVTKTGQIKDCYVCEIGPGPGNITRAIIQNGAKNVFVIEKDRRFLPSLELLADACGGRMKIILADVMDLHLENIFPRYLAHDWMIEPPPFFIIGNLPFNISTPLIIKWLRHCSEHTGPFIHGRTRLTLTFQKEVAERMIAKANAHNRCRLSIMCQYLCHVDILFTIPGKAFFPKPEVDVCVVKFTPRIKPAINQPFKLIEKVASTIFHHRQKFCSYGLKLLYPNDREDLYEEIIKETNINPEKRSFQLEMEEYRDICDVYSTQCTKHKGLLEYNYLLHKKKDYELETFDTLIENKCDLK